MFVEQVTIAALYRDLFAVSYHHLSTEIAFGFNISQNSLRHDTKVVRGILAEWGKEQIILGTWEEWDEAAENGRIERGLEHVNLWMDSTDIQLAHREKWTRKGEHFSGKMMKYAQRYQVVQDGKGLVLGVWGGYSPKVYDGEWVSVMKQTLAVDLFGGHVIADTHYETANHSFQSIGEEEAVVFHTPIAKPRGPKKRKNQQGSDPTADPSQGLRVLTKEQIAYNKRISRVRGRVESVFGTIKHNWESLDEAWRESERQQNYVVFIAIGAFNWKKRHPQ